MIELELLKHFRILDLILIMGITNLISEQTIGRRVVFYFYKPENYLNYNGYKKTIFDILTCPHCLSVWISIIWLVFYTTIMFAHTIDINLMLYPIVPLISLLTSYLIHKK
jgi:hypothetical protein